jgi:hypothetical protein
MVQEEYIYMSKIRYKYKMLRNCVITAVITATTAYIITEEQVQAHRPVIERIYVSEPANFKIDYAQMAVDDQSKFLIKEIETNGK